MIVLPSDPGKANLSRETCDIRDLTEMQALKMSVASKASAQRLVDGIIKLVINGLVAMV